MPLRLAPPSDFPDTSHLTAEEVRAECERLGDDTEHDDPSIEAGREEFAWWLEQCRREGLAMVTFQYGGRAGGYRMSEDPSRRRALLCWEFGGGGGHAANLASVAGRLEGLGYEVAFYARYLESARAFLGDGPTRLMPLPFATENPARRSLAPRGCGEFVANVAFPDDQTLRRRVEAWRAVLEHEAPSVVVFDHAPVAMLASRWRQVRRVLVAAPTLVPPDTVPLTVLASGPSASDAVAAEGAVLDRVNSYLVASGLEPLPRLGRLWHDVDLLLTIGRAELDPYSRPAGHEYFGAPSSAGMPPEWPSGDGPRVFCYFHRTEEFPRGRSALFALAAGGARVLAYVPGGVDGTPDDRFPSIRVVEAPLDLSRVAAECDFACTNGGSSTASSLLGAGTPHLVFPLFGEQRLNGMMVQSAGGGLLCDTEEPEVAAGVIGWMLSEGRHVIREALASRTRMSSARHLGWNEALDRVERLATA
ncbi:MAG: glycosyltransferase [Lacipirellulaceae bacterium]